jgi:hypothetical protein
MHAKLSVDAPVYYLLRTVKKFWHKLGEPIARYCATTPLVE